MEWHQIDGKTSGESTRLGLGPHQTAPARAAHQPMLNPLRAGPTEVSHSPSGIRDTQ